MRILILGIFAVAVAVSVTARADPDGAITGKVVLVSDGRPVPIERVWVYVEHEKRPPATLGATTRARIAQVDQEFKPSILVIPIGTTVDFPVLDKEQHSVFSPAAGTWFGFELGRYFKGARKDILFKDVGEFNIYCDIHEQMAAVVKVVRTMHQAIVPASGEFRLAVPPGRYQVWAWTPHSREVRSEYVDVKSGAPVAVRELRLQRGTAPATHLKMDGSAYGPIKY